MSHLPIRLFLSALAILLTVDAAASPVKVVTTSAAPPNADDMLRRMASLPPDDCTDNAPDILNQSGADVSQLEGRLFSAVKALVADRLNAPIPAPPSDAGSRASSALREVEQASADINKGWPTEDRFHFKVLVLPPAILVQMSFRDQAGFGMFGSYYLSKNASNNPGTKWREVDVFDPLRAASGIDLFPLHRGPSGRVRFLMQVWHSGCAGSIGEDYYGHEWNADDAQIATEIIKIEGAEGLDDTASTHVGKLSTSGNVIQLPYCFFSAVDTWDNPTLCAADSFDLSGDDPVFSGRVYNNPDLVTVAKVIQYAEAHDYVALRGYCTSDMVAKKIDREFPPYLFADSLDTVKAGPAGESIRLVDGNVSFDLIKSRGRWLVEGFKIAPGPK
jgi:hypothetical protein